MAPITPSYQDGEKVLCFHQDLLYEAKILDTKTNMVDKKPQFEYLVHYRGWKATWDQWVPQDRLRKWGEENLELAKNLKKEVEAVRNQAKASKTAGAKRRGDASVRDSEERSVTQGKKRARDYGIETEENWIRTPAIRIAVPDEIKSMLVDDWENVTKGMQLVPLPAKYPVSTILQEYFDGEMAKEETDHIRKVILEEIIVGLKEYFNKSLGRLLLYKFERPQYEDILAKINNTKDKLHGKEVKDIYGCEHLLRLIVSLPELVAQTNMDQQSTSKLREEIVLFSGWLGRQQNIDKYLSTPYEATEAKYQDRANA